MRLVSLGPLVSSLVICMCTVACTSTKAPPSLVEQIRNDCSPELAKAFESVPLRALTPEDVGTPAHAGYVVADDNGKTQTRHNCVFRLVESDIAAGLGWGQLSQRLELSTGNTLDKLSLVTELGGKLPVRWVDGQSVAVLQIAGPAPPLSAALYVRLSETLTQEQLIAKARAAQPGPPQVREAVLYTESDRP